LLQFSIEAPGVDLISFVTVSRVQKSKMSSMRSKETPVLENAQTDAIRSSVAVRYYALCASQEQSPDNVFVSGYQRQDVDPSTAHLPLKV
jgi:hypothetical protein